jgi:ribonuclease P protein component
LIAARNAFGKSHRLLTPGDFRHVFQRARKRSLGGLVVYVRTNDLGHSRLGIAISRKCSPRAVVRNRIKRIVREAFRARKHELGGVDLIFLGQPGVARHDGAALRAIADKLLTEAGQCVHP